MPSRTKCQDCGANRGLADYCTYTFCFACWEKKQKKSLFKVYKGSITEKQIKEILTIKTNSIPKKFINYLAKYGLEVNINGIIVHYCQVNDRLFFTYNNKKSSWARSLSKNPKWLFIGDSSIPFIYRPNYIVPKEHERVLVLVEDILSAIKVGRNGINCLCLGGTTLKLNYKKYLKDYEKIIIWFDGDKAGNCASIKLRMQLKLTHALQFISTTKDPKCISDKEIKYKINNCIENFYYSEYF